MNKSAKSDIRRVVVVGAGAVGSTYCYALAQSGLSEEIVVIDKNEDLARGQVLDLVHGKPFFPNVDIRTGTEEDYAGAQLVVVTAGSNMKPGETRIQLLQKNASTMRNVAGEIAKRQCKGVMLIVSNPVDVLTYVALQTTGWDRGRVIGSGTVLDSARFRYLLAMHCNVDVHNVHAYILGEHGDSEFAAWSMTNIAGIRIDEYCPVCENCSDWKEERKKIVQEVRDSAYHIINYKGSTHYGVGMAMIRITEAILRNQQSILSVSSLLTGEFGIRDVCLSVPCIVSGNGVVRIVQSPLAPDESAALKNSAEVLSKAMEIIR
ncbi:MAG TPA: L-lactate dehydrogenase [Bacteroidales bacterium]|nr:L-lactate dehydrogenase [Bacteroidales bacterium]